MKRYFIVLTALVGVVAFLVGLIAAGSLPLGRSAGVERPAVTAAAPTTVAPAAVALPPAPSPIVSFADVADRINAARTG